VAGLKHRHGRWKHLDTPTPVISNGAGRRLFSRFAPAKEPVLSGAEGSACAERNLSSLAFIAPRHPRLACHPDRSGRFFPPLANARFLRPARFVGASAGRAVEGSWLVLSAGTVAGNISPFPWLSSRTRRRAPEGARAPPAPTCPDSVGSLSGSPIGRGSAFCFALHPLALWVGPLESVWQPLFFVRARLQPCHN